MAETEIDDRGSRPTRRWLAALLSTGTLAFFALPPAALATVILEAFVGDAAYLVFVAVLLVFAVTWLVGGVYAEVTDAEEGAEYGTAWILFVVFLAPLGFVVTWAGSSLAERFSGAVAEAAEQFFWMIGAASLATFVVFGLMLVLSWVLSLGSRAAKHHRGMLEEGVEMTPSRAKPDDEWRTDWGAEFERELERGEPQEVLDPELEEALEALGLAGDLEPAPWERGLTLSKPRVLAVLVPVVVLGLAMGLLFLALGIAWTFGLGGADEDLAVGVLVIAPGAFSLLAAITVAYLFWRAPEEQLRDSEWFWRDANVSDADALPGTSWGVVAEAEVSADVDEPARESFATATGKDEHAGATVLKVVGVIPLALVALLFLATGVMAFFDSEDGGVGVGVGAIVMGAVPIALAFVGWRWPRAGGLVLLFPVAFPIGILFAFEAFSLVVFALVPAFSGVVFLAAGLFAHRANRPTSPHPPLTVGPA